MEVGYEIWQGRPAENSFRESRENRSPDGTVTQDAKAPARTRATKRFNVVLPAELLSDLEEIAEAKHTTVLELIRRFIKLGLLAVRAETTPELEFIVRERGVESRVMIL
jgi:hypothetical protein